MDRNAWLPIRDFSTDTLFIVAQGLKLSTTRRHGIARERPSQLERLVQEHTEHAERCR
jgi:hypothetical protein